jgi:signal transduction histidine kinase
VDAKWLTWKPLENPVRRPLIIFGGMLLITIAHYVSPPSLTLWHEILERLYYVPIILGACYAGWLGGLLFAACAGICYMPHILMAWHGSPQTMEAKYAEILVFFAVGGITGYLSQRERKRRLELQNTTAQLEIANTQLKNSFEQIKRADRLSAIGQLAASLAHEIRNPLGSIEGAIDIVDRTQSEERRQEFLGVIKKETKRLSGLLTSLLDFARPRPPQVRQVRIETIVELVVRLTAHNAQQRGIQLESEIASGVPLVECDAEQITQALLNVTLNALQATPSGGTVRLFAESQTDKILVRVRDEGDGIDEATLEKIFDPFFTTREGGTGLGLPISQQILTHHHGRITVERNAEKGMTFTLELPLRQNPS